MKLAIIEITDDTIVEILKGFQKSDKTKYFQITKDGIPEDAEIIHIFNDKGIIKVLLKSESFSDIEIPNIAPMAKAIYFDNLAIPK